MKTLRIGATLSEHGLRWALVDPEGRKRRLIRSGWIPKSSGETEDDLIRRLRIEVGPEPRWVRLTDDAQPPVLRVAHLPPMSPAERDIALQHEAQSEVEILGGPVEHAHLPLLSDEGPSSSLLAIIPRSRMHQIRASLGREGFLLEGIYLGPVVLYDVLRDAGMLDIRQGVGMMDLGSERANLAMIEGGRIASIRQVHQGVDSAFLTGTDSGAVGGGDQANELDRLLEQVDRGLLDLVGIVGQVRRSVQHASSAGKAMSVQQFWLAGDAARARSLALLLQNDLRIPVDVVDPRDWLGWEGTEKLEEGESPSFALCLGLAGLAPAHQSLAIGTPEPPSAIRRNLAVAAGVGLLVNATLLLSIAITGSEVEELQQTIQTASVARSRVAGVTEEEAFGWIESRQIEVREHLATGLFLDAVARAIPDAVVVERLALEAETDRWSLVVEARAEGRDPEQRQVVLGRFLDALRAEEIFPYLQLAPLAHAAGSRTRTEPLRFTVVLANRPIVLDAENQPQWREEG